MATRGRSAITLVVLCLLLLVAAAWGWSAATSPLPGKVDAPLCVSTSVAAGSKVFPQDVTVSVFNAGTREGLAGRIMRQLTDQGFAEGNSGNVSARKKVGGAQIWTEEPGNPAVRLVATRLGRGADVVRRDGPGAGVTIVVGDAFRDLAKGRRAVVAKDDATICSPPV